jgi:hypothetical protein
MTLDIQKNRDTNLTNSISSRSETIYWTSLHRRKQAASVGCAIMRPDMCNGGSGNTGTGVEPEP